MLTHKIFDTFLTVLQQQQMNESPIASVVEGQHFEQVLEGARLEFEYKLSKKLLALTTEKQVEFLTQILALFEHNSGLFNPSPRYLWYVDKLSDTDLIWYREPNESPAVKAFRDECERHISTDLENFLAPSRAFSETAKEARRYVWLVTNPGAIGVGDEMELDCDEMELHYEAGRWIEEGLRGNAAGKAQENVRQHFEKLAGKAEAMRWISSPDKWYDSYREIQGLPLIESLFQSSYEAWHFYSNGIRTPPNALLSELTHPWEKIEALAEQIGLRKQGRFTPPGNKVAVAVSGFIDALREARILSQSVNLPILYRDFTIHYSQKIGADRISNTRLDWQSKARKELGLH